MKLIFPSATIVVTLILLAPITAIARAANITYSVAAVVMSAGYSIQGGYITTNGALGTLSMTDIVDYQFVVNGLYPFVFSASSGFSPSLQLGGDLVATPDAVYLPWSELPQPRNILTLTDTVGSQNFLLNYQNGVLDPHESVSSISYFITPPFPPVSTQASFPYGNSLLVASIPEPTSAVMFIWASLVVGWKACRLRSAAYELVSA